MRTASEPILLPDRRPHLAARVGAKQPALRAPRQPWCRWEAVEGGGPAGRTVRAGMAAGRLRVPSLRPEWPWESPLPCPSRSECQPWEMVGLGHIPEPL